MGLDIFLSGSGDMRDGVGRGSTMSGLYLPGYVKGNSRRFFAQKLQDAGSVI